jgi:glucose-6-phosphate dehydrogenase assembly protein OpcA
MIISLTSTTSAKISAELLRARRSAGSPAQGMVLTLIIVCDESEYAGAMEAGIAAGREHPSRILLVVTAGGRIASLDAEVHIGEGTPGEVVVIRMRGAVAAHPASVIRPLLLPDSPVVIWWPDKAPQKQAADELAQLAMRRLTDAAASGRPLMALKARANPAADLLVSWLHNRLKVEATRKVSEGPGLTAVRMTTASGDIAITRPDGLLASYAVPGQPERLVALKRRDFTDLISEELRRMDEDEVYERTVKSLLESERQAGRQVPGQDRIGQEDQWQESKQLTQGRQKSREEALDGHREPRNPAPCRARRGCRGIGCAADGTPHRDSTGLPDSSACAHRWAHRHPGLPEARERRVQLRGRLVPSRAVVGRRTLRAG